MSTSATWNLTIENTSPLFQFSPYGDGIGPQNGWSMNFNGAYLHNGGDRGDEPSASITTLANASVTLAFKGRGISIYGSSTTTYDVALDNDVTPNLRQPGNSNILFSSASLTDEDHRLTLTAHPDPQQFNEQLSLDKAEIVNSGSSAGEVPVDQNVDNASPSLTYTGAWTVETDHQIPNMQTPSPYRKTTTQSSSVTYSFTGGAGVSVIGARNWGSASYSVTVDGSTSNYNGSTFWLIPNALLHYSSVSGKPNESHNVTLTNTAGTDPNQFLQFTNFVVHQWPSLVGQNNSSSTGANSTAPSNATTSNTKPNVGGIVGGIIGGLVALSLIASLAFFLWRKKRSQEPADHEKERPVGLQQQRDGDITPFDLRTPHTPEHDHEGLRSADYYGSSSGDPSTRSSHSRSGRGTSLSTRSRSTGRGSRRNRGSRAGLSTITSPTSQATDDEQLVSAVTNHPGVLEALLRMVSERMDGRGGHGGVTPFNSDNMVGEAERTPDYPGMSSEQEQRSPPQYTKV